MSSPSVLTISCLALYLFLSTAQASPMETCPHVVECLTKLDAGEKCPLFPLPPGAALDPIRPVGFNITNLRPGVYHYNDGTYQVLFLYSKATRHLVVLDFPRAASSFASDGTYHPTTATMEILGDNKPKLISMIYSHRHLDHIGEAMRYKTFVTEKFPNAKVLVHGTTETKIFISRSMDTEVPQITHLIGFRPQVIRVGPGLDLKLIILGGHTNSDVLAFVPKTNQGAGVIHFIDIIFSRSVPFLQFGITIDLRRYISVQEELMKYDFEFFSTGHGRLGQKQDLETNVAYTRSVVKAIMEATQEADPAAVAENSRRFMDPTDAAFGNTAFAFSSQFDIIVGLCKRKIIREWGCKLGAVDIYGESHCLAVLLFINTDV